MTLNKKSLWQKGRILNKSQKFYELPSQLLKDVVFFFLMSGYNKWSLYFVNHRDRKIGEEFFFSNVTEFFKFELYEI